MADTDTAVAEEYFPNDTYHSQWFLFWILAAFSGFLIWKSFFRPMPATASPRAAISAGYEWFFVLHMPEAPKDPARADALQRQFTGWLDALVREGYHPMLLSDVKHRQDSGVGLPYRAVVLVFDPGYFNTYERLSPVLVNERFPAVWITDHTSLLRGDRHFIHRHQANWMVRSGFWDLAYSGDGFWRRSTDPDQIILNENLAAAWTPGTGRHALNWGASVEHLQRLDISPKWTAQDLINRLETEIPLQGTVHLGIRRLPRGSGGVVIAPPDESKPFALHAPLSSNSANIYWFGTNGVQDVQLDITTASFFGETLFWLRSDSHRGRGIGVGFTRHSLFVDQMVGGTRKRLKTVRWDPPGGAIKGRITLAGSDLRIAMKGADPLEVPLASQTFSRQGFIRMEVYDRVRGAAHAESVDLTLTPLTPASHAVQ